MSFDRKEVCFLEEELPSCWSGSKDARAYLALSLYADFDRSKIESLFPRGRGLKTFLEQAAPHVFVRSVKNGVLHPMAQSLSKATGLPGNRIVIDQLILVSDKDAAGAESTLQRLNMLWREPAIENVELVKTSAWVDGRRQLNEAVYRQEISFDEISDPAPIGLEFSADELAVIQSEAKKIGRLLTRAEWELLAQTWSEHCKHKIFNAEIETPDLFDGRVTSLFKTCLRRPTEEISESRPNTYLSVFSDNAGVVRLFDADQKPTPLALAMKMETHNSPSAISPYGGASTGIVGVHRDILGTGLGAMPIASWDVLCFETPGDARERPATALPADVIRAGVIRGIQDGGNQSGIPTVQGSVVFSDSFAAKPLVFAGTLGLLDDQWVHKKAKVLDTLYCVGGAVGPDGLRGAVMSSRELRQDDMGGAAVQVAQPFVQRMVTDFLLKARDAGLISSITDNGAGGLASSVGEMSQSTGGAEIDLSNLRLKFDGLLAWERLLSESQERMTVATSNPEAFEALAAECQVEIDLLGRLTDSGRFLVKCFGKTLVSLTLDFLHEGCPRLKLKTKWNLKQDLNFVAQAPHGHTAGAGSVIEDFERMLSSFQLCSREGIVRRFDHEVQGRTLRLPFQGELQKSPADGTQLEIFENAPRKISVALGHGLAPTRRDIHENVVSSVDEALRSALLSGLQLESAGFLDNFCWPDPLPSLSRSQSDRYLWRLVRSCDLLARAARIFRIPFISGKDSMKNTAGHFDIEETLVVSVAGSAASPALVPASYFSRANDVVFYLPPLTATLTDSIHEKICGRSIAAQKLFTQTDLPALDREIESFLLSLHGRYQKIEALIHQGLIRSAKDVGEGGLLTAIFEMSRGRRIGVELEDRPWSKAELFEEGLGAFVFNCDLHVISKLEGAFPELRRLGVTSSRYGIQLPNESYYSFERADLFYERSEKGDLWS